MINPKLMIAEIFKMLWRKTQTSHIHIYRHTYTYTYTYTYRVALSYSVISDDHISVSGFPEHRGKLL